MPPEVGAELPESVLLLTFNAPLFEMPPPKEVAELPESVLLVTFTVPASL